MARFSILNRYLGKTLLKDCLDILANKVKIMARMHSRVKGKSRSTKPAVLSVPEWVKLKPKEVEMLIVKQAKEGLTTAQIGLMLRDEYGIPNVKVMIGKSIGKVLEEKNLTQEVPEDLLNLIRKSVFIRKHLENNHKDQTAKRGLILTESKIRRLAKYHIKANKLPANWKYDPEKIKLLVS